VKKNNIYDFSSHDEETIIAQCTPSGPGALALLRISGINAVAIADTMSQLASGKKLLDQPSHTIHYGSVISASGEKIDSVLFLLMRAPKTFTGQDTVEITSHNNTFIISAIIERVLQAGARLAQEGEFSRRAFLNGKLDLAQAEAINDLIHANTQTALKASLAQLEGSLSQKIQQLEQIFVKALALCEASFEFVEDESFDFEKQITDIVLNGMNEIRILKKQFSRQKQVKEGVRIALLGSVNAGKSSLFNCLLQQDRAIVTSLPGTTRDVLEGARYQHGTHQTIIDTAGLRQTDNSIEQEGISRALNEARKADIILLVFDGLRTMSESEKIVYNDLLSKYQEKIVLIKSKIDLANAEYEYFSGHDIISVSSKNKKNISLLEECIKKKIQKLFYSIASPFLLNRRHYNMLVMLEEKLKPVIKLLDQDSPYELLSVHLNDALVVLSELSGKTVTQTAVDEIFKNFCIGK